MVPMLFEFAYAVIVVTAAWAVAYYAYKGLDEEVDE